MFVKLARGMEIFLLVGSESGTAEMVADAVQSELVGLGHPAEIFTRGSLAQARLAERAVVLVCSSTTGIGDIPQNVRALYEELVETNLPLSHLRYGVIGLGDKNYKESYLGAPKKWDAVFQQCGAQRIGSLLELDATENPTPDLDAAAWVKTWAELL